MIQLVNKLCLPKKKTTSHTLQWVFQNKKIKIESQNNIK